MSTGRTTGDELRLLRTDREITAGRRRMGRVVAGVVALLGMTNALTYIIDDAMFRVAGGIVATVLVGVAVYWLLLRTLSQPRTSDLCPRCGEEHIEHPVSGVASEPDVPYCPAPGCEWTGQP